MVQRVAGDREGKLPTFVPGEATWPFAFPIIVVAQHLAITAHRSARTFGVCDERAVRRGECPAIEIFAGCGRAWKPVRILAASEPRAKLFGHALVAARFELAGPRAYDLEDLRDMVARSILDDPEDTWTREVSEAGMFGAVEAATTFAELADVIIELGGHGE